MESQILLRSFRSGLFFPPMPSDIGKIVWYKMLTNVAYWALHHSQLRVFKGALLDSRIKQSRCLMGLGGTTAWDKKWMQIFVQLNLKMKSTEADSNVPKISSTQVKVTSLLSIMLCWKILGFCFTIFFKWATAFRFRVWMPDTGLRWRQHSVIAPWGRCATGPLVAHNSSLPPTPLPPPDNCKI